MKIFGGSGVRLATSDWIVVVIRIMMRIQNLKKIDISIPIDLCRTETNLAKAKYFNSKIACFSFLHLGGVSCQYQHFIFVLRMRSVTSR